MEEEDDRADERQRDQVCEDHKDDALHDDVGCREPMDMDLRRQLLRLLLGFLPGHPTKDQRTDSDRTRLIVSGCVLVDDGEEFDWETDSGCGGSGHSFGHDSYLVCWRVLDAPPPHGGEGREGIGFERWRVTYARSRMSARARHAVTAPGRAVSAMNRVTAVIFLVCVKPLG